MSRRFAETVRDRELCLFVHSFDGCTVELLIGRFWPASRSSSAAYSRIGRLIAAGYLGAIRLPAQYGIGSGKRFLILGTRGRKLVAAILGRSVSGIGGRRFPASPIFVQHHLAICRTRLAIERAVTGVAGFDLRDWSSERLLRQRGCPEVVDHGKRVVVIPDAAFQLAFKGAVQRFVLEQDMATLHAARLRSKLRAYFLLTRQPDYDDLIVLFVVPDDVRREAIVNRTSAVAASLASDPSLVWVAIAGDVQREPTAPLLAPIWQIVGGPASVSLAHLAATAKMTKAPADDQPSSGGQPG